MDNNVIPEIDIDFLQSKRYQYEILSHNGLPHLLIKDYPIPSQFYDASIADILIHFPAGYPNAPLDMFWTYPTVRLLNGSLPTTADYYEQFHGRSWQRWSRHGSWRPGVDGLQNFVRAMNMELNKGI